MVCADVNLSAPLSSLLPFTCESRSQVPVGRSVECNTLNAMVESHFAAASNCVWPATWHASAVRETQLSVIELKIPICDWAAGIPSVQQPDPALPQPPSARGPPPGASAQ